jgi:hypothetical protein
MGGLNWHIMKKVPSFLSLIIDVGINLAERSIHFPPLGVKLIPITDLYGLRKIDRILTYKSMSPSFFLHI